MLRITYIGHATLLIELGGKRSLTDPNFDPALGKFLPRVSAPGIPLESSPELDAILRDACSCGSSLLRLARRAS